MHVQDKRLNNTRVSRAYHLWNIFPRLPSVFPRSLSVTRFSALTIVSFFSLSYIAGAINIRNVA